MPRRSAHFAVPILSASLILSGCQTPAPEAPLLRAADGSVCPGWEDYDGAALIASSEEETDERQLADRHRQQGHAASSAAPSSASSAGGREWQSPARFRRLGAPAARTTPASLSQFSA
jgi:hypothetical protein